MKEKVRRLEEDFHELKEAAKSLVPFQHFEAVIGPMAQTLREVQTDIKEVLRVVSKKD